jgi:catechol 2,3-dioxygenase-like lactoylglutathione lyase family enzyme
MLAYATVGTNDLERARGFYDAVLGEIGARRVMEFAETGFTMYGTGGRSPGLAVTPPYDGQAATPGNGQMPAIGVDSRDKVERVYGKALALGGSDEGPPGLRGPEGPRGFYGAYFRDLDGNKLCVFCIGGG